MGDCVNRLILVGVAAVVTGCAEPAEVSDLVEVGTSLDDNIAQLLGSPGEGTTPPVLLWVLRTTDWIPCQAVAGNIRHLQRRFGGRMSTTVLHVGKVADTTVIRTALARERIAGGIRNLSEDSYRAAFRNAPTPAWYIVSGGHVVAAEAIDSQAADPQTTFAETLEAYAR